MGQISLQTGRERRRHWSEADQRDILRAAFTPGAVVTEVSRRFDVSTSLIYKWRRRTMAMRAEAAFVPAVLVAETPSPVAVGLPLPSPGLDGAGVVVELAGGSRVTIAAHVAPALAAAVLGALR